MNCVFHWLILINENCINLSFVVGYRLESPPNTPECIYELMIRTWDYNPDRRPHFTEIRETLDSITSALV